ncbi:MAG: Calx-beta domain-containing protein, partial [Chloroflexota bacterium]
MNRMTWIGLCVFVLGFFFLNTQSLSAQTNLPITKSTQQATDLIVQQSVSPAIVAAGGGVTYTILVENQIDESAHDLVIESILPAEITNRTVNGLDAPATLTLDVAPPTGVSYRWLLSTLATGEQIKIIIQGRVATNVPENTTLTSSVTVRSRSDLNPIDNVDSVSFYVGASQVNFDDFLYKTTENEESIRLRVTLEPSNPTSEIRVPYHVQDGTAILNSDYQQPATATLVFAPGQTEAFIDIDIVDDGLDETDELLTVRLGQHEPLNAAVGTQSETTVMIIDDDPTPSISISGITVNERESTALVELSLS